MLTSETEYLPLDQWRVMAKDHRAEARKWTEPYRRRRASRQKHPVFDFLFTYYPFSLGKLEQWHPGYGTCLECPQEAPIRFQCKHYQHRDDQVTLTSSNLSDKERVRLKWTHNLLSLTQNRNPNFACHGLHEWAMVYSGADIRHRESAPLRLSQEETDRIVESLPITCSHFDAFRFFAPAAHDFNRLKPTLKNREDFEQPGCLHTNMDLYKWASKCMPWIGSSLLWQCFKLALKTRELDMRASPYDLSAYGYSPVQIETPQGRRQYERLQREISSQAFALRGKLIESLRRVIASQPHDERTG